MFVLTSVYIYVYAYIKRYPLVVIIYIVCVKLIYNLMHLMALYMPSRVWGLFYKCNSHILCHMVITAGIPCSLVWTAGILPSLDSYITEGKYIYMNDWCFVFYSIPSRDKQTITQLCREGRMNLTSLRNQTVFIRINGAIVCSE